MTSNLMTILQLMRRLMKTCSKCNRALGLLKDDPEILLAAYSYLKNVTIDSSPVAEAPTIPVIVS